MSSTFGCDATNAADTSSQHAAYAASRHAFDATDAANCDAAMERSGG
jgi:hypothetical protein